MNTTEEDLGLPFMKYLFHARGPIEDWKRAAFYDPRTNRVYLPAFAVGDQEWIIAITAAMDGVPSVEHEGHPYIHSLYLAKLCRELGNEDRATAMETATATVLRSWTERS